MTAATETQDLRDQTPYEDETPYDKHLDLDLVPKPKRWVRTPEQIQFHNKLINGAKAAGYWLLSGFGLFIFLLPPFLW
eukprot:g48670.t1